MPSGVFTSYAEACLQGTGPDLTDGQLYIALITRTTQEPDLNDAAINLVSELEGPNPVEDNSHRSQILSPAMLDGAIDAADTVISAPAAGGSVAKDLIVYYNTGTYTTDTDNTLIAYYDLGVNAPTPAGNDITINWHASGLFKLG